MKKILSLITIVLLAAISAIGQAPGIFNYQGVARNSVGNVLVNKLISLRLTVHDGSAAGATVYQESRTVTTNPFGLFNVQVGSAGASNVTGTIAGVPWGVGAKFIQVEIDPNGGTSFINIGTAQIASVPYSLFATTAGDIVLPFNKTQADAGTLFKITNSGTGAGSTALEGLTNSQAANAYAIIGTVTSASPGGFSSGVRGINNGTGGLGIGVYGSQNGSGWGVYGTTPSGIGVNGNSASGFGVFGSSSSGIGVYGTSSTGRGGFFEVTNNASTADAVRAETNGTGASWAVRAISSGTNGAGLFQQTNAANTANNLQSNQGGLGRAGLFNVTNAASTATAVEINSNGALASKGLGVYHTGFGPAVEMQINNATSVNNVLQINNFGVGRGALIQSTNASNNANIIDAFNAGPGWVLNLSSSNASPKALRSQGAVQFTGLGEANNFVFRSDATGFGTWVDPAVLLPGANYWSRVGTNLFATNLGDNVGIGTNTPTHKLTVTHGGSTGIGVTSTAGFSVMDINAANGDAALRFQRAGVNQWNIRNRPADDYLEIFELGGGGSRFVIQNATGNVGIGTDPAYRLDVTNPGSSGIRSKSTSSFAVVDIDGASGDAALRFQNAGVNQWNIRNRPADNYLEIFELGGGGSRFVIQDGTGFVGINQNNPAYELDVLNNGASGIRSKSSGSFSVVDIDGFNGDAALRFQKNGVNQWNIRNRPADNYLEIFELGGGGSRFVIQDGTGFVGINQNNPTYELDVLNSGASGIRSKSSGTFSVVDIDGFNGDAALRFQKNGVNQWNIRNRPSDDFLEIFELGGGGSRLVIANSTGNLGVGSTINPVYKVDVETGAQLGIRSKSNNSFVVVDVDAFNGDAALRFQRNGSARWNTRNDPAGDNYQIYDMDGGVERMRIDGTTGKVWVNNDFTVLGVKAFTMDHPLDPANKSLMHAAAESNEVINFYSGNITTDANGKATVKLPDYYEALNKDSRYQLTVIGSFAQAIISKEVSSNQFEIATSIPNVKVSWEVKGVRNDAHMKMHPFVAEEMKSPEQRGKYFDPAAHNQPASKHVSYDPSLASSLDNTPLPAEKKIAPPTTGGSLDQRPIEVSSNKPMDNSGSVEDVPAAANKSAVRPVDKTGSVADEKINKEAVKPAPVEKVPSSLDEMPKPEEQKKSAVIADKKVEVVKTEDSKTTQGIVLPAGLKLETTPAVEKTAPAETKTSPAGSDTKAKSKTN